MSEEIMIDGVNVAECDAYKEGHCLDKTAILLCDTNKCSNYKDCYYKQLQRLKQENENYAKLMLEQQGIARGYYEALEGIKKIAYSNQECEDMSCYQMMEIYKKCGEVLND